MKAAPAHARTWLRRSVAVAVACCAARAAGGADRLAGEASPYVRGHAGGLVDWYPWGPEAFEAARRQDKPIFLSIGHATCHWCRVMQQEILEDQQVAAALNEQFVPVVVDRDERPELGDVYLAGVREIVGRAGWPLAVFVEPQGLGPFAGGTYFGPGNVGGRPSFLDLLDTVRDQWEFEREGSVTAAEEFADGVRQRFSNGTEPSVISRADVERAVASLMSGYDADWGGFRIAPKFPQPAQLAFLMAASWDDEPVRQALLHTLDAMATGGIYDQVGGGFHRYSIDRRWRVPHFEKMLYGNAQLASLYAGAYERTGDPLYREVVAETLDYVLREMASPDGAFYSAQDAKVGTHEGASYVWTPAQVAAALDGAGLGDDVAFALDVYGLDEGGNFRDSLHPDEPPRNVLYLTDRPDALASKHGMGHEEFRARLARVNDALAAARRERPQPLTDDQVLTEWNALMITAMVDGATALGRPRYLDAARRAARFLLSDRLRPDGRLDRTSPNGASRVEGLCGDYAQLIAALVALHRAEGDPGWLGEALALAETARDEFRDDRWGGYFDTPAGRDDLFARPRTTIDSIIPGANSVMLNNLLDLYELTGEQQYVDDAAATLAALSGRISQGGRAAGLAMIGYGRMLEQYPDRIPRSARADTRIEARPARRVTVSASPETVTVGPGSPGRFDVTLDIGPGQHVVAHEGGAEGVTGLEFRVIGRGFQLDARYPAGAPFPTSAVAGGILAHNGRVTVPVEISPTGEWTSPPRVVVVYQVCTADGCEAPRRVLVAVSFESAG